jgi:hypothetical protein
LVWGLVTLIARYCLGLRRRAKAGIHGRTVELTVEWSIMGKRIRETRTVAPITGLSAVRLENRQRYLYLLIGFGALVVSTWVGIQWFVQGLRAGYPYLALVGAGVVAAGIAIDLLLYFFIPEAKGKSRLLIALGPWKARLAGVESREALGFVAQAQSSWDETVKPSG